MDKKADLRIYNTNIPSALSLFVRDLKEQGISIENDIDYIDPKADPTMPSTVIINPPCNPSKEYYSRIKQCAQNNPTSRFILFIPDLAPKTISTIKNLEYWGKGNSWGRNRPIDKLKNLADVLISQKQNN